MKSHSPLSRATFVLVATCAAAVLAPAQSPGNLTPAEAAGKVGQTCTVEFVVKSTGHDKDGTVYLNSEQNFRGPNNFAVTIPKSGVTSFPAAGKDGVESYFRLKQIRVTGRVEKIKSGIGIRSGSGTLVVTNKAPELDPNEFPSPPTSVSDDFDPNPPSYLSYYFVAGGVLLGGVWYVLRARKKRTEEVAAAK